jgi:predicted molibdopterin-dependent oxidoreductase YjgC
VFGAGGGTSSYREIEETDLIILWGSNARETHPIFFHHVLKGVRNGARLYTVDPRRTSSAAWADVWLGIDVGSDIALANAVGREIIVEGLHNAEFIDRATTGFAEYRESVESYTLERAQKITGVRAEVIRELAHSYARADRAEICWTLGITEHHNAVDNVLAIINLALLTGHVGRYGSGLNPLRGQNNVQGGGDMGAIPNKFPGGQDVENPEHRARFERAYNARILPQRGWHLSQMFEAMEHGKLRTLYIIGENPAQSEADCARAVRLLEDLDHLVVQDIFLTKTAEYADVVLPAAASWCESEGTVTNSERRVQRVRKALDPPAGARDDIEIICALAKRLGRDWGQPTAADVWDEIRSLSPWHGGMSYRRLEALGGLHWPCPDETHPGSPFLHARLWGDPVQRLAAAARDPIERFARDPIEGPPAPFIPVEFVPPVDELTADFPVRLTTGRRLDSFNTGVQTAGYSSPLRWGETIDLSPEDAERLGIREGERVRIISRRGAVVAPVRFDTGLRPGLAFMTLHFQDDVATNLLTIDATDPKSGTAEFKATAVRVEKLPVSVEAAIAAVGELASAEPHRGAFGKFMSGPAANCWCGCHP